MRNCSIVLFVVLGGLLGCGDSPPHQASIPCDKDSDCPTDWFCLTDHFCYSDPGSLTQAGSGALPSDAGDTLRDGSGESSIDGSSAKDGSSSTTDASFTDSGVDPQLDASIDGSADAWIEPGTARLGVSVRTGGVVLIDVDSDAGADLECDDSCGPRFALGTHVTLTAVVPIGTMFTGWDGVCSGKELTCEVVLDTDSRVIANFKPTMHELKITKLGAGGGSVAATGASLSCGSTCTTMVAYGTTVTLTGTPNGDSLFGGWGGSTCTGVAPCTFMITGNVEVSATFPLDSYTLIVSRSGNGSGSVSSAPAGISCGADCNESYEANQVITLTASATTGSTFAGWSGGGCSGTGTCNVTMTGSKTVTATFTLKAFVLTVLRAGNGSGTVTSQPVGIDCGATCMSTQNYGATLTLTAAPSSNSDFTGWTGGGCSGTGTCSVTITDVSSVTATFTLKKYNLTVSKNGTGSGQVTSGDGKVSCGATCSATYDSGQMTTLTAAADASSTFTGWSGSGCSGTGTCTVAVNAALNVSATFTLKTYTLSITKNGNGAGGVTSNVAGINCGSTCSATYNAGQTIVLTAAPSAGSTFSGWSGSGCTGTGTCSVTLNAASSVTATFALQTFSLSVSKAGNGSGVVDANSGALNCGSTCSASYDFGNSVTLTATPASNSTFTGWGGACSGTGTCTVTMNSAVNVSATFALKQYRLTVTKAGTGGGGVTSNPAGIDCGSSCANDFNAGQAVVLTAAPDTGSTFAGWSGACSGTGTCSVTLAAASTVTATFTLQKLTLGVSKSGNGSGLVDANSGSLNCGSTCSASYDYGQSITLTATESAGSTFTGWGGACSGTGSCVVAMTAARTVTATFTLKQFALNVSKTGTGTGTVTSGDGGTNCGSTCSPSYNYGSMVTLTATPDTSSTFAGWSGGGCSGTGTCNVTVNAIVNVSAAFTIKTNTLSITKNGNGAGTVTSNVAGINCGSACSATYDAGQVVVLTAAPATGSTFSGWSGSGCTGTGTCSVTMNAASSVTATFALQTFSLSVSKSGNGSGVVAADSGGLSCGSTCSASYDYNQSVTLTATPSTGSTFTGWGGACSGTGSCVVAMTVARTVRATFTLQQFTLTVSKSGSGSAQGYVSSSDQAIDCGSACSATYNYGSSVTLNAQPSPLATFNGWSGGGCSGTGSCSVTLGSNTTVTATFVALPNYAFVTEATVAGDVTVAGADALCKKEAADANLPGKFVAWLSTDGSNGFSAASRLGKARGWIRTDGEPIADRLTDLANATAASLHTFHPIRLTARGADVGHRAVFTGTAYDGTSTMTTCSPAGAVSSWSSVNSSGSIGSASATGLDFTNFGAASCGGQRSLYCFGIDNQSPLTFKLANGRKAFVTRKPFIPTTGRDGADKLCQDEADAAGISGTFLALLATSQESAAKRFVDNQTTTWVRMDGIPLMSDPKLLWSDSTMFWDAPLNIAADGTELYDQRVWSGVPVLRAGGNPLVVTTDDQNTTCNDWVSNKNTANAGRISDSHVASGFGGLGQQPCSTKTLAVACLQK